MSNDSVTYLTELRKLLDQYFSLREIESLCFQLGVTKEFVAGTEKSVLIRGLLNDLGQDGRLPELVALAQKERPNVAWPAVPDDFEMPASLSPMRSQQEELRDYVRTAVATYTARMNQAVLQGYQNPEEPYKSLYAFDIEDANIFFGRDGAVESLYETVLKDRLTVVYARSGAGKTSLLNAGLTPRLITDGRLPVFARTYHDPVYALKQAVAPKSGGLWPALLAELSLHDFLGEVCRNLGSDQKELVVVLDQFEEFLFLPEVEREGLVHALADCYNDKGLRLRLVVSIREDYFMAMADAFERESLSAFANRFRLPPLGPKEWQMAITGPVQQLDRAVSYEKRLLDALLVDLALEAVALPYLQLVCAQLYEELPENVNEILLDNYEAIGRMAGVLSRYLQETLDVLPHEQREMATAVLKALVSSETTKRMMSEAELAARFAESEEVLEKTLAKLVNRRLLRRDEVTGEIVYELAHEIMIEEIRSWFDESDLRYKQAEEMLAREVANWRIFKTLIPKDRLEFLYEHRDALVGIDSDMVELLLRSAAGEDRQVERWTTFFGQLGEAAVLTTLIKDIDKSVRLVAAEALGKAGDEREIEPLIDAFEDVDKSVRLVAAKALVRLGGPAIDPLIAALKHKQGDVRAAAMALGESGDERAVEPLIAALKDEDENVRGAAAEALGRLGDERAVEPLIAALKNENRGIRAEAAKALGQLGDERAVEPLIAALHGARGLVVTAAEALGRVGDKRAVEPLINALKADDEALRWVAAGALGQLGDERAVQPLIAAFKDENYVVKESAAEALVKLGKPAVESLVAALKDEDYHDVRWVVAETLEKLGWDE